MRHPHHMPPPLPNPIEIERAVRHLEAQIRAKHADTLADRISGMSKPGELEYQEPEHDPWTPSSWAQTFKVALVITLVTFFGSLLGVLVWQLWDHDLIELIRAATLPRLG